MRRAAGQLRLGTGLDSPVSQTTTSCFPHLQWLVDVPPAQVAHWPNTPVADLSGRFQSPAAVGQYSDGVAAPGRKQEDDGAVSAAIRGIM